jgi:hypothetical protein
MKEDTTGGTLGPGPRSVLNCSYCLLNPSYHLTDEETKALRKLDTDSQSHSKLGPGPGIAARFTDAQAGYKAFSTSPPTSTLKGVFWEMRSQQREVGGRGKMGPIILVPLSAYVDHDQAIPFLLLSSHVLHLSSRYNPKVCKSHEPFSPALLHTHHAVAGVLLVGGCARGGC